MPPPAPQRSFTSAGNGIDHRQVKSRLHVGIFGPGDSGKTFLAQALARSMWEKGRIKSIVLDPNRDREWGNHCFVTDNDDLFQRVFWRETQCAIFIEEATETIARDKAKSSLFTRGRHRGHKIFVVGHDGMNLLRVQRQQLHTVFLFKQLEACGNIWAQQFADPSIMQCVNLRQYEFLLCRNWMRSEKRFLEIDEG